MIWPRIARWFILTCCSILFCACQTAAPVQSTRLHNGPEILAQTIMVGHGKAPTHTQSRRANSPTGLKADGDLSITQRTFKTSRTVPAKSDRVVVIGAEIIGLPAGSHNLRFRFIHPEWKMPGGKRQKVFERQEKVVSENGAAEWGFVYLLEYDFERTPGVWTFELWKGNQRIYVDSLELIES